MYKCISYIFLIIFSLFGNLIHASDALMFENEVVDTVKRAALDSVTVSAGFPVRRGNMLFAVGTRVAHASVKQLEGSKTLNLSDYLKNNSSLHIKEYGRGMRSYFSVRGTSASHSSVRWNGMELAVPTLGMTDLSHIPVYFFDRMSVHAGGSSALYGDGSMGGTLSLHTKPVFREGVSGDFLLSGGSYSTLFTGATVRYSSGNFESRSSLFFSSSRNDFRFRNNAERGFPVQRQDNSAYSNGGALQEFYIKSGENSLFAFRLWYLSFDREIQPSVVLNDKPRYHSSVYDNNIRSSLSYTTILDKFKLNADVAFASDYERFKEDIIETGSLSARTDADYSAGDLAFKAGVLFKHSRPTARSFDPSVKENRLYLFMLARYTPQEVPGLVLSAGLRGGYVTDSKVPLMPSFEAGYKLLSSNGVILTMRGSVSGSSKVPSLNDRYWGGVHTYLESESSLMAESGFDFVYYATNGELRSYVTLFTGEVDNWIRWLPAGEVWRPANIPEVSTQGVESGVGYTLDYSGWRFESRLDYSYTDAKTEEPLWEEDPARGEQLAYVPRHTGVLSISAGRGDIEVRANVTYTGERTTLDIYDMMEGYLLFNAGADYRFSLWGYSFLASGSVLNITAEDYQSVKFYAMPGRNWNFSLRMFF
jgi:iron complex outermembrane receptor protein